MSKLKLVDDRKAEHVLVEKEYHFISVDQITFPSLRLVHKYPNMYPKFQVDKGAIKFVLKGANVMCKGLTN